MTPSPETLQPKRSPILSDIVFNPDLNLSERIFKLKNEYGFSGESIYSDLISLSGKIPEQTMNPEEVNVIINRYKQLQNLENHNKGQKANHNLMMDFLFPRSLLPCITAIYNQGIITNNLKQIRGSASTMILLDQAIKAIPKSDKGNPFSQMEIDSSLGKNNQQQKAYTLMALARLAAIQSISNEIGNPNINLDFIPKEHKGPFQNLAKEAIQEYQESQEGINLSPEFQERIRQSQAVVLSVDINSVVTVDESFANTRLTSLALAYIDILAQTYKDKYPNKNIFVVINTGRPAHYAWGILESLSPLATIRSFGLAENGGVVLLEGMESGTNELTTPVDQTEWQEQLSILQKNLLNQIFPPRPDIETFVETKKSMVSIKLADKIESDKWLHSTKDGQPINPQFINKVVISHLSSEINKIEKEISKLLTPQENSQTLINEIKAGPDKQIGTKDDFTLKNELTILQTLKEGQSAIIQKQEKTQRKKATLEFMLHNLDCQYNPSAGYIDIGIKGVNKHTTLAKQLQKRGVDPSNAFIVHIGDSNSDLIQPDFEGDPIISEAVSSIFLVGVANSKGEFKQQVEDRKITQKGYLTSRRSILGLIDTIKGIQKIIESALP